MARVTEKSRGGIDVSQRRQMATMKVLCGLAPPFGQAAFWGCLLQLQHTLLGLHWMGNPLYPHPAPATNFSCVWVDHISIPLAWMCFF